MKRKIKSAKNRLGRNLTDNSYVTFSALYAAQGIPEGITYFTIPAWLVMNGTSTMEIAALVSFILIPWNLKILIALLMDRYSFLSMGRLRMFIGGYLLDYFGKIKMLTLLTIIIALFAFIANLWSSIFIVIAFIVPYCILYTFLCIAIFASAMHVCWKTVAAIQFTLYMAFSNMGRAAGASLLGILKTNFNWETVFLTIAVIPFVLIIIIQFINLRKHRIIVNSFDVISIEVANPPVIKNQEYT